MTHNLGLGVVVHFVIFLFENLFCLPGQYLNDTNRYPGNRPDLRVHILFALEGLTRLALTDLERTWSSPIITIHLKWDGFETINVQRSF